mmetsp:Transcript_62166/g.201598  ORF Transcript_62166/g.201598 Transcript_62166/m.201598 type:complete len:571 (-) Transcript_62166:197-1909(-)
MEMDHVLVTLGFFMSFMQAILLGRSALRRKVWLVPVRLWLQRERICECCARIFGGGGGAAKTTDHVQRLVDNGRQSNMRACAVAFFWIMGFLTFQMLLHILSGGPRIHRLHQDLAFVAISVFCLLTTLKPQTIHAKVLSVWYGVAMCLLSAASYDTESPSRCIYRASVMQVPRCLMSMAYGKLPLVTVANVVMSYASIHAYSVARGGYDDAALDWQDYVVLEAFICVCTVGFTSLGSFFAFSQARLVVGSKLMDSEMAAMRELLNLVCDVVVELDAELRVADDSPKIAAFLTMNPKKSIKGKLLKGYMPKDADRKLFEERMLGATSAAPGAVHLKLRGSNGNSFSVEMFYVKFRNLDGHLQHLAGIREFSDAEKPSDMMCQQYSEFSQNHTEPPSPADRRAVLAISPRTIGRACAGSSETSSRGSRDHRKGGKGTPSVASSASLSEVSMQSDLREHRSSGVDPASPLVTREVAMDLAVANLLRRLVIRTSVRMCCPWHAALLELKRSYKRLKQRQCGPDFGPTGLFQCQVCGIVASSQLVEIVKKTGLCDVCGKPPLFKYLAIPRLATSL